MGFGQGHTRRAGQPSARFWREVPTQALAPICGGTPLWRWELVFGAFDWAPNPGFGDTRAAALAPNPGFVHTGAAASCAIVVRMWTRSIGEELGSWATRVEILLILVGTLNGEKLVTNLSGAQVGTQFDCFVKPACIPSPPVFGA